MTVGSSTEVQTTQAVDTSTQTTGLSDTYDSVQYNFAKLQMQLAQQCEDKANEYMEQIEKNQELQQRQSELENEIAEVESMIKLAEECKAKGESGQGTGTTTVTGTTLGNWTDANGQHTLYPIPQELVDYCEAHDIDYCNADGDYIMGKDEWNQIIDNLEAYEATLQAELDEIPSNIGDDTQILMTYLQDCINQYNSYLQGANSAISESFDILQQMAQSIQ